MKTRLPIFFGLISLISSIAFAPSAQAQTTDLAKLGKDIEDLKKIVALQQSQLESQPRICSGSTLNKSSFQAYGAKGITINVDTSSCGFKESAKYFTNLSGNSSHWMTSGATSIYNAHTKGFQVYIYFHFDNENFAHFAASTNYEIQWLAIGK